MPLYYLNESFALKEFYTDEGSIREALSLAKSTEFVRFSYYHGVNEFNGKKKTIFNNKAHPDLKLLTDWMCADIILKKLYDLHLHTLEFRLEFDAKLSATYYSTRELVIKYNGSRSEEILKSFSVPPSVQPALIANPGSLYFVQRRSGMYQYMGYYDRSSLILKQNDLEQISEKVFTDLSLN